MSQRSEAFRSLAVLSAQARHYVHGAAVDSARALYVVDPTPANLEAWRVAEGDARLSYAYLRYIEDAARLGRAAGRWLPPLVAAVLVVLCSSLPARAQDPAYSAGAVATESGPGPTLPLVDQDEREPEDSGALRFTLHPDRHALMVTGRIAGREVRLLVDTGSRSTIVHHEVVGLSNVDLRRAETRGAMTRGQALAIDTTVDLGSVRGKRRIAAMDLSEVRKAYRGLDGILGMDVLQEAGCVTVDFRRLRLHLGGTGGCK